MTDPSPATGFDGLGLSDQVLRAVKDAGYTTPTKIQTETIPVMLTGVDVVGQAQTGTGKTAAFALPLLSRLDWNKRGTRLLVLTPTRELAIQVAATIKGYSRYLKRLEVCAIYGGADFRPQLRSLRQGAQVVVGTPGRVMDHMRRGTLKLDELEAFVLDEADEMLRMGFIDDVEWIIGQAAPTRQIALFSATMPAPIRRIADRYLNEPKHVTVAGKSATAETVRQRYVFVKAHQKLQMLTDILDAEDIDGVLIFVRTKIAAAELAGNLQKSGKACAALSGDIGQSQRERIVRDLKRGALNIIVATDVAARGIDVSRISHVINYDLPGDTETYVHRIGRTGRAGNKGETIMLLTGKQERARRGIENATRTRMERLVLPSLEERNNKRVERLEQELLALTAAPELEDYEAAIAEIAERSGVSAARIAGALVKRARGGENLKLTETVSRPNKDRPARRVAEGMERYRLEVGRVHGAQVGAIVGAIANETGLSGRDIGKVDIRDDHTIIDLPDGMPKPIFQHLKKVRVSNRELRLTRAGFTRKP